MNQAIAYRRPAAAPAKPLRKRSVHQLLILGFLIVLCTPITIAGYVGGVLITPYRVYVMILFPYMLFKFFTDKSIKPGPADLLVFVYSAWTIMCVVNNIEDGVQRAGQYFLETVCAYLLARVTIRSMDDLLHVVKLIFYFSLVAFILAVPEAITRKKFIMDTTSAMTGMHYAQYAEGADVRLGMRRPQAFFSNTILYGLFCASCIALVWYTAKDKMTRWFRFAILAAATFFSLSSGPLLAMNVQLLMIFGEYVTRGVKGRVPITLTLGAIATVVMNVTTNSGIVGFIVNHLTFNSASAFNRILIWNWGVFNIQQHPIFGLDADNWVRAPFMKPSCDNYWIVITMLGGLPALSFLILAILTTMWKFAKIDTRRLPPIYSQFRTGWFFAYIAFAFTGFSVMFFGGIQPLFFFMLGIGGSAIPIYQRMLRNSQRAGVGTSALA
ncbi:O-antigen ligase family protein [Flavisphingomonas formosensis]|uniref:O-antigen ligase family protein n=1 Tax=Flavisphingomonas formosensis TaxID=861534 RepID=UPI0012FB88A8|nr:hypothetical protein [Sphingomonas formosensis]